MGATSRRRAGRRRRRRSRLLAATTASSASEPRELTDEVEPLDPRTTARSRCALTAERQALESALIPVTAYILIACVECYRRYPEMMEEITAAAAPGGARRARATPGDQIDGVHLWSIANFR